MTAPTKVALPNIVFDDDDLNPDSIFDPAEPFQLVEPKYGAISDILRNFRIPVTVVKVESGPVVSRILLQTLGQLRISAIKRLETELAFYLKVPTVRVDFENELGLIALEIPAAERQTVRMAHMLPRPTNMALPIPGGVDLGGVPAWFDLASLPHLLVAGTTGSGKSVYLHSVITALLLTDADLCLIDPKRGAEFGIYRDVARTLATTAETAYAALLDVKAEMERRYAESDLGATPIVVVVDELAHLFEDFEQIQDVVITLAQLGRAARIHLVLATQRPSHDIVTGRVKANFPARVAFMTATGVDSRVILDETGAEKLLGRGDGLFSIPGQGMRRLSAAMVTEDEIERVIAQRTLGASLDSFRRRVLQIGLQDAC